MRKIAKFTALTTLALAGSNLAYADTANFDTGLRVFGGIGGGLVTPSLKYSETQPAGFGIIGTTTANTSDGEGVMLLSTGMRYYFERWILGAIVEYNPFRANYFSSNYTAGSSNSGEKFNNLNFVDLGGQIGFRATPNTNFLVSVLAASGEFSVNDTVRTTAGVLSNSATTTKNLAGVGFGLGMNYRFEQHLLMEVDYRYLTYNTASVSLLPRVTGTVAPNSSATFKPTQSMIDLSLVAEF